MTLWKLLRDHPGLWLPDAKEAPFFSHTEVYERGWASYAERLRVPAGQGRMRGTVTPHYMQGWRDASTATVAARVAGLLPEVRLVALLREPVARARSQHAMAIARGQETREADRASRHDAPREPDARPDFPAAALQSPNKIIPAWSQKPPLCGEFLMPWGTARRAWGTPTARRNQG